MRASNDLSRLIVYIGASIGVLVAAILVGLVAASGSFVGQMVVFGLMLGGLLLLLPLPALLVILLVVTFVLQGSATYFLRFQQAAWLPYLLCLLLSVKAVDLRPVPSAFQASRRQIWNSPPLLCLGLYVFSMACATLINRPPLFQVVIGLKNALPLWVAAALIYRAAKLPRFNELLWTVLSVVFFLQLPLVLYQHFVIVPKRRDAETTGMDAVVGSFGGLIDAGGANSTLVLFALLVMAYQLALWVRREAGFGSLLLYWTVGLVIVLAGEVKAALIWMPLIVLYVMRHRVLSSFGSALTALLVSAVLVSGVFAAYSALYWQKIGHKSNADLISRMDYFFDTRNIDYRTGEISRGASLALWATDPRADLAQRVVGNGPGASRISATGGLGEVARRYAPLEIAATSVALLLWDAGLLGLLGFTGVLVTTAWLLHKQSVDPELPAREQAAADAFAATLLMFLSLLIYNRSLNDEPSVQMLLAIALGCALHWRTVLLPPRVLQAQGSGIRG